MNNNQVITRLNELQEHFADGKFWNHDPACPNNPDSVTDTPCSHHIHGSLSTCDRYGTCGCNSFGNGIQCYGFALYMAYKVFGSYPDLNATAGPSGYADAGNGWKLYRGQNCSDLTLEPGDVVRKNHHSAIIWKVDGNVVKVGEVWGDPKPEHAYNNCKINWGNFNGISSNGASYLLDNPEFVAKAPKDSNEGSQGGEQCYRIHKVGTTKFLSASTNNPNCLCNYSSLQLLPFNGESSQKWITNISGGGNIRSSVNTDYGLHATPSGAGLFVPDVGLISRGGLSSFEISDYSNVYKLIKWRHIYNGSTYYLSSNGTSVYLETFGSDSSVGEAQKWSFMTP